MKLRASSFFNLLYGITNCYSWSHCNPIHALSFSRICMYTQIHTHTSEAKKGVPSFQFLWYMHVCKQPIHCRRIICSLKHTLSGIHPAIIITKHSGRWWLYNFFFAYFYLLLGLPPSIQVLYVTDQRVNGILTWHFFDVDCFVFKSSGVSFLRPKLNITIHARESS